MIDHLFKRTDSAGIFYLAKSRFPTIKEAIDRAHLLLLSADIDHLVTADAVLRHLGHALHLPDWYGANLDALFDCLADPDWYSRRGLVLSIHGLAQLSLANPSFFASFIEVLQAVADTCQEQARPLWILLDTAVPGIPPLPNA